MTTCLEMSENLAFVAESLGGVTKRHGSGREGEE